MEVFILIYEHRHGRELSAYANRELAEKELADLIEDDLRACVEHPLLGKIKAALEKGDIYEARDLWSHSGGSLDIQELTVLARPDSERERSFEALWNAANDDDAEALERIMIRAGMLWQCEECGWNNDSDDAACEDPDCPGRRPEESEPAERV